MQKSFDLAILSPNEKKLIVQLADIFIGTFENKEITGISNSESISTNESFH